MIHKFCDFIENNLCKVRPRTKLCHVMSQISRTQNNKKDKIIIIMIDIQVVEIYITYYCLYCKFELRFAALKYLFVQ